MEPTAIERKEHEALLRDLFQTIPALQQRIAPNGFEKSPYYHVFHYDEEFEYKVYRRIRTSNYLLQRKHADKDLSPGEVKPYLAPEKLSFIQFLAQYVRQPAKLPHELIALVSRAFYRLVSNGRYIFRPDAGRFDFEGIEAFNAFVVEISIAMQLIEDTEDDKCILQSLLECPPKNVNVDFTDIKRHIFAFLEGRGIDWVFREYNFEFLLCLQRELEERKLRTPEEDEALGMGRFEAIANYLRLDEPDESNGFQEVYPDFASEFSRYMAREPRPVLRAYREVYGCWPEGYPPKMTDYI